MTTDMVATFRATLQSSNRKGMAQVHQTRPRATGGLRDTQGLENLMKGFRHRSVGKRATSEGNEQVGLRSRLATAAFEVVFQHVTRGALVKRGQLTLPAFGI